MKIKSLGKIISYIFIVAVSAVVFLLAVSIIPIPGNYKVLTVLSGSMEPAIKTGSVVIIKPQENYDTGNVITFEKFGNKTVTHRIAEKRDDGKEIFYTTKGDANNAQDQEEVSQSKIIGKVLFDVSYLGYAVNFAKKPLGFVLIVIVPMMIIVGDEIKKIYGEIKKKKKK